ncbi:Fe(3+)-hydroxamate ABC transporter substrate-binding protein FhuD [Cedecea davisae]|uniref:Fe(3+)-hydroxamate ABC transporter substrate-binding protein FhuD n=1 Tax=Cedecea davisae TaxID=158484 RepID=A0ABS6DMK2_9ENTR|nr:Fe(3+)-hydroxamate ABC transporter substrate-binding protein FhuD [Cedecea davisae]MBU4684029.1 Fe(3+)-hydroxamate ABC transporter substrate-binding protein FhuD [Cedecea davisae]MBU4688178.1 Fe(3+)-hydroxamate ABC transporter substrate-binding protein FhuD [Cedecea davisae]
MDVSFSRRRLLTLSALLPLVTILPGRAHARGIDSERIIALEWRPVEMLLALGIMPLAIADKRNYHRWVREPALPDSVVDVGLRNEPNRELMQRLRPSAFIISKGFGPSESDLTPIAPCWSSAFNDASGRPLGLLERDLLRLGQFLGREQKAVEHLTYLHQQISATREKLPANPKPLVMFSFLDSRRVMIFGANSLFNDLLERLGLRNAWEGKTNPWGSAIVGIETLVRLENVTALCFMHGDDDPVKSVAKSALWQVMPFVREGQLHLMPAVWFYGGSFSALRFCQLLPEALCA